MDSIIGNTNNYFLSHYCGIVSGVVFSNGCSFPKNKIENNYFDLSFDSLIWTP